MNLSKAEQIVAAVLYEGYILYPYRASAVKNRRRFNFGTIAPPAYCEHQTGAESSSLRTEVLVTGDKPAIEVRVRFLHPLMRQVGRVMSSATHALSELPDYDPVDTLEIGDKIHQSWQEVVERDVSAEIKWDSTKATHKTLTENYPATETCEALQGNNGTIAGVLVRRLHQVDVQVDIKTECLRDQLFRVSVIVSNQTSLSESAAMQREEAMLQSPASAHIILGTTNGSFVSLLDPAEQFADDAAACRNEGCWPVFVGGEGDTDMMLASPIILYDYPEIAPESCGDFFDGTEIDEMLALRVMTLTDDEKRAMRSVDARARAILERTESMPDEHMQQLHGAMRLPTKATE